MTNGEKPVLSSQSDNRHYGLDALKFLSMVFVVMLHAISRGGMYGNGDHLTRFVVMALFYIATPAVNLFSILTGYLSYSDNIKPLNRQRLISLWLQVVFYSLLITISCHVLIPDAVIVTPKDYLASVFPLFFNTYWYFTAFFFISILSPLVNNAIRSFNDRDAKRVFIVLTFFCSVLASLCYTRNLIESHSFAWLFSLYILGAIIKKTRLGMSTPTTGLIIGIIVCNIFNWLVTWIGENYVSGSDWYFAMLSDYVSPTIVLQTFCYLFLFNRITVKGKLKNILRFLSPSVFAAYLINTHPIVYVYLLENLFTPLTEINPFVSALIVIAVSCAFVLCACLIDKVRIALGKLLRLNMMIVRLETLSFKITDSITKKL